MFKSYKENNPRAEIHLKSGTQWAGQFCFLMMVVMFYASYLLHVANFHVFKIYQTRILPRILLCYSVSTAMIPFNKGHFERIMFLFIAD